MAARFALVTLLLATTSSPFAAAQSERPSGFRTNCYAITKARVVPRPGEAIDPGTLVIRDGVVIALGPSDSTPVPPDAETIDGAGLVVYAGFLDAGSPDLIDPELKVAPAAARTVDFSKSSLAATAADHRHQLTPELRAAESLKLKDDLFDSFRQQGVVAVNALPGGRIAAGRGALVALNGHPLREALLRESTFQSLELFGPGGRVYPSTLMGATAHLRQAFLDARRHAIHLDLAAKNSEAVPRPPVDAGWTALDDVAAGRVRATFFVTTRDDIHRALDFAAEQNVRPILWGARDAVRALDRLVETKSDVLLTFDLGDEPKVEPSELDSPPASPLKPDAKDPAAVQEHRRNEWRERAATAARLRERGLRVALSTRGLKNRADLPKTLRAMIKAGLSTDDALALLTTEPAAILGASDRLGTLAVGRPAFVIVMTGPLDHEQARVRHVFIDDRRFEYHKDAKPVSGSAPASAQGAKPGTPATPSKPEAADVAGEWAIDIASATGKVAARLTLSQNDGKLTGAFASDQGNGRVVAGTVRETAVEFTVGIGAGERTVELKFQGTLTNGKLAGDLKPAFGAVTKWTATRTTPPNAKPNPVKLDLAPQVDGALVEGSGSRVEGQKTIPTADASANQPTTIAGSPSSPSTLNPKPSPPDEPAIAEVPVSAAPLPLSPPAPTEPAVAELPPQPRDWRKGFPVELPSDRTFRPWQTGGHVFIRDANVLTGTGQTLRGASILVRNGKFVALGADLSPDPGMRVVDAAGRWVMPGIIDTHSHIMITQGINEATQSIVCECRIRDVINTDDVSEWRALAGGVTAARIFHGSANVIGGQDAVVKLKHGRTAAEHFVRDAPQGIKFALGENVKFQNGRFPNTRLGVEATLNRAFLEAIDYRRQWMEFERAASVGATGAGGQGDRGAAIAPASGVPTNTPTTLAGSRPVVPNGAATAPLLPGPPAPLPPRRDLRLEALADIVNHRKFIHSHCYRSDEILMLLNVAQNLGVRVWSLQHVLEGYKVAPEIVAHGASCSTFADWWAYKVEAFDAIPANAALLHEAGANTVIKSDDWELIRHLYQEASKTLRYGNMPPDAALQAITRNPARELGLADRMGTIEPGKDADFAIYSRHPFDVLTRCDYTFIDGELYFSRVDAPSVEGSGVGIQGSGQKVEGQLLNVPSVAPASPPTTLAGSRSSAAAPSGAPLPPGPPAPWTPPDAAARRPVLDAAPSPSGKYAFVGATLHPIDAPDIERGTLLVIEGKIAGVGSTVEIPSDAKTIDASGLHIYPGLIDAGTTLGLVEIGKVGETHDYAETGAMQPDLRAGIALNPDSELLPVTRIGGVTTILLRPTGGLISGQASLAKLAGWTAPEMILDYTAGLQIQWPTGGDAAKRVEQLSEFLKEARLYDQATRVAGAPRAVGPGGSGAKSEPSAGISTDPLVTLGATRPSPSTPSANPPAPLPPGPPAPSPLVPDPRHEALRPYVRGEKPVFVEANARKEIAEALLFAEKEKLKIVITGGTDAWKLADELKRRDVPVIVGPVMRAPVSEHDPYDAPYANAGRLHAAGVRFCFRSNNASNSRNVPFEAGMAAAHGLPEAAALRAVTLGSAELLGLSDRLGSLTIGKQATFQVTDGSPLQPATQIKALQIDGRPIPLESRQTRFYDRYRTRLHEVRRNDATP